ncbi:hypothetical protein [Myxococcus fulvus]|uniref:hypothetical protein n=1 Tax=Myxococcus fulvus TaxID=33 RepID=UPI0020C126CB|nr:hypothetical protein [Myxococcus fulvus]MCK8502480.1 hypothetical protein [Myxococcus fulvus]
MTTLTMRTNPMKRSNLDNLWSQFNAASGSLASASSTFHVGFARLHGQPPVPC